MTEPNPGTSRRNFLKTTGTVAAASALAGVAVPAVHAARTTRSASPWSAAAAAAPARPATPCDDQAGADQAGGHGRRLRGPARATATTQLKKEHGDKKVDVPDERKFIGFDAYQKAMDCLKPGDVVILATPPAFRWVHFTYAIEKGLNTFMEKPVTVDGPTTRKMLALGEEAKKKNLKVGVGLMCRHCEARERALQPDQGRPDRRHPHAAGLSPDRPGRLGPDRAQARRHQRAAVPDPASSTASSGPAAAASATS